MITYLRIRTLLFISLFLVGGNASNSQSVSNKTRSIEEIRKIEKDFESDLNNMGVDVAFEKYAAPNAVIKRENDSLVYGPKAIKQYYSGEIYKSAKVFWTPDFIDVSQDGTMAYTYGKYRWIMTDKSGKSQEFSGVFHTVWKKQANGLWKYVWD